MLESSPPQPLLTNGSTSSRDENSVTENDTNVINSIANNERSIGILVLLTVPLAWGTYSPVVKYMYEKMDPSMPGFVFSAGYYLVAAASLGALARLQQKEGARKLVGGTEGKVFGDSGITASREDGRAAALTTTRGGWELGSYLFIGNGLQVVGLQTVPADRAAFLVQLTTIMVPLVSATSEGTLSAVPLQTWIACIIAFAGVIIMGADDGGSASGNAVGGDESTALSSTTTVLDSRPEVPFHGALDLPHLWSTLQLSRGDALIVGAALAYTLHVVRLGAYAPKTDPLKLAAAKASTEAALSVALVLGLTCIGAAHPPTPEFVARTGAEVLGYGRALVSALVALADGGGLDGGGGSLGVSVAAILWTGWVTCAYTIYAQSFGQGRVNPTDSNLIYTIQPLFSSLFAYILLGETLGFYGYVGAALIGAALWLVSFSDSNS